jgi:hypothetical protein
MVPAPFWLIHAAPFMNRVLLAVAPIFAKRLVDLRHEPWFAISFINLKKLITLSAVTEV